ncbi:MAG TPA: (2Fe-2S) ferredoxin domain-containing protein [Planctomycetota bacterium]|nr:(2Fe-2S) ferredoxin domain-containing protein [Planctomycetota bacterium]
MAKFQKHVFVCQNERTPGDPRGSCTARGSAEVLAAFKEQLFAAGFKRIVRPNKAGCLDQCAHGVCVVIYPDAVWYGGVTPDDVASIIEEHIRGGVPVQRLLIPDDELTGIDPARAK